MKKCPICSKDIPEKDLYCAVCEEHLAKHKAKQSPGCQSCLVGCLIMFVIFIVLSVAGGFYFKKNVLPKIQAKFSSSSRPIIQKEDIPEPYQEFFSEFEGMFDPKEFKPENLGEFFDKLFQRFKEMLKDTQDEGKVYSF